MKKRITFFILSVGIVCILIAIVIIDFFISQIYTSNEIVHSEGTVNALAENIIEGIGDAIRHVERLSTNKTLVATVLDSNDYYINKSTNQIYEEINAKDDKWLEASGIDDHFVAPYIENDISFGFHKAQEAHLNYYEEIFVTNKYGEMIAATNYISNINQKDEYWWEVSFDNGMGKVFIDDRGYDVSAKKYVIGIAVPVYHDGEVIGVLKANINTQALFTHDIKGFLEMHQDTKVAVVRTSGNFVFTSNTDSPTFMDNDAIKLTQSVVPTTYRYKEDGVKYIISTRLIELNIANKDVLFGGLKQSSQQFDGNDNESWHLLYMIPLDQIKFLSNTLYIGIILGFLFLLVIAISLSITFISNIINPIEELADAAHVIGSGDLDYKIDVEAKHEVKKLADAMSRMLTDLKVTLASRDELKAEMEAREKVQKEKEEMSKHLAGQQKMEAIGTLASGVAHEINNPINGIMNYAQLLYEMDDQTEAGKNLSSEIIDESKRVSNIVHNLISFSNHTTGHFSKIDIKELIDQCIELVATQAMQKQVRINVNISEGIDSFDCRPQQLKQVIINLMTNAIESLDKKYNNSEQEKQIDIFIKEIIKEESPWIEISIKDNGIGMENDVKEKIFEPFFTTQSRASGTGLGLYISHSIITEHGGLLTFESEPGQGATFKIALPIVNPLKSELI